MQGCGSVTQSLITGKIYNSKMENDSSEPEAKEASWNRKIHVPASRPVKAVCLEKLVAMNATKTELRLYTLAIIIAVDTTLITRNVHVFSGHKKLCKNLMHA